MDKKTTCPFRLVLIASEHTFFEYAMYLRHLLLGLADESIPVALVCPAHCDPTPFLSRPVVVIPYPVVELPLVDHLNRKKVLEELAGFEPTVLHCLCRTRAALTRKLARRLDIPYVLSVNALAKKRQVLKISRKRCAAIIVPAQTIADSVARVYPRLAPRIRQINIGTFVDTEKICFSDSSRLPTIGITPLTDHAGILSNLFNVFRHLLLDGYEFMVWVMGGRQAESRIRKLLTHLDLTRVVTIVPVMTPWRSILAAGDIYVRAVPDGVFNPFLLEAMSTGAAVAACRGGVDDLIVEDQTAVVFDPHDELSIMRTLKGLLDRREYARKLADHARQHLKQNHSVSRMISATLDTCRRAVISDPLL